MNILLMTIPVSITLGIFFILFFLSAVRDDQFEDLETPAHLPFSDDQDDEDLNQKEKELARSEELILKDNVIEEIEKSGRS